MGRGKIWRYEHACDQVDVTSLLRFIFPLRL